MNCIAFTVRPCAAGTCARRPFARRNMCGRAYALKERSRPRCAMCDERRSRLASGHAFCYLCPLDDNAERAQVSRPGRLAQSPRRLQTLAAPALQAGYGVQVGFDHPDPRRGLGSHTTRSEALSHGGATGFTPPEGIRFHRIPEDKSLISMLVNRELDAAMLLSTFHAERNVIDRSTRDHREGDADAVTPLFPDLPTEGRRYVQAHGFVPVNHCYVIRGDVHEKHPWLAFNLFAAFTRAKEHWLRQLPTAIPSDLFFGSDYLEQTRSIVGQDPFPYGIRDNAAMLRTLIDYSFEQKLTPRKLALEEVFAPGTLDL